jgi:hypothetical protein
MMMSFNFKASCNRFQPTLRKHASRTRKTVITHARVIRACRDCEHYSDKDDTCNVLSILNYKDQSINKVKSLYCRTREDLCGIEARYYENKQSVSGETMVFQRLQNQSHIDCSISENTSITYSIDGSSGLSCNSDNVDLYYDNLHKDFNDVY